MSEETKAMAKGLLGFDDSSSVESEGPGASTADEGELAAAEDFMAAAKGDSPERLLSALKALLELV